MDDGWTLGLWQWRRQGLMVGEAHLVGEENIFNVNSLHYPRMLSAY